VESTGLSGTDRLLGGVFGAARGLALVLLALLVAGLTPIPQDPWWQQSRTIARLMPLVDWADSYLPESVAEHLQFEPDAEPEEEAQEEAAGEAPLGEA
jgi:membrane protein required for colicin V production